MGNLKDDSTNRSHPLPSHAVQEDRGTQKGSAWVEPRRVVLCVGKIKFSLQGLCRRERVGRPEAVQSGHVGVAWEQ